MNSFPMLDAVFAIIILVFTVIATIKGFVNEMFGKISFFVSLFLAFSLTGLLEPSMSLFIPYQILSVILSFVVIFAVIYLGLRIAQYFVHKVFENEILGGLDHSLGFILGLVEGVIIVCFILVIFVTQPWFPEFSASVQQGFFYNVFYVLISSPIERVLGTVG